MPIMGAITAGNERVAPLFSNPNSHLGQGNTIPFTVGPPVLSFGSMDAKSAPTFIDTMWGSADLIPQPHGNVQPVFNIGVQAYLPANIQLAVGN